MDLDPSTVRQRLKDLELTDPHVHAAMWAHKSGRSTYVETLELLVVVLAETNTEAQKRLFKCLQEMPVPIIIAKTPAE